MKLSKRSHEELKTIHDTVEMSLTMARKSEDKLTVESLEKFKGEVEKKLAAKRRSETKGAFGKAKSR